MYHVPCGKCIPCITKRRNDWTFRIKKELEKAYSMVFLTLTYTDESIPLINEKGDIYRAYEIPMNDRYAYLPSLNKKDVQKWLKKLRKLDQDNQNSKLKYYIVGEYGDKTGRPHYHAIMWNYSIKQENSFEEKWSFDDKDHKKKYKLGNLDWGQVTPASIHYVTGYVMNQKKDNDIQMPQFAIMSKGVGKSYIEDNKYYHAGKTMESEGNFFVKNDGYKQSIPRYYKDMVFSIKKREKYNEKVFEYVKKKDEKHIQDCLKSGKDPFKDKVERFESYKKILNNRRKKGKKL